MSKAAIALRHAFSALSYGDYRRFAVSLLFNSMSTQLVQTAIFWQVFEITGSPLLLGLTGLVRAAPHILFSLVGGIIADRLNRVLLIQVGQVLNAVLIMALAFLTITGTVDVWHLYVVTLLNGAFTAASQPARTALIPSLVPRNTLINAVGLNATVGQFSMIAGPAAAGVGIATVGLGPAYLLTGALYIGATIAILGVRRFTAVFQTDESPWRSFANGMTFVASRPVIISLLVLDLAAVMLGSYRALLPIFAELHGVGPSGYGFLSAAPGVGSLLGAGAILALGDMKYKGLYTVFGVLGYSAALMLLALSPWFSIALVAGALLGTTNSVQMIPRNSVILAISPDALRGRVDAFRSMLAGGGPPIGYSLSGGLAALLGAPMALVVGAIACAVVVAAVGLGHRTLRDAYLGFADRD